MDRQRISRARPWSAIVILLILPGVGALLWYWLRGVRATTGFTIPSGLGKINYVVIILKENRTFDFYFGRYPGADGATSGLLPNGTRVPLAVPHDTVAPDIWHGPALAV